MNILLRNILFSWNINLYLFHRFDPNMYLIQIKVLQLSILREKKNQTLRIRQIERFYFKMKNSDAKFILLEDSEALVREQKLR